MGKTNVYRILVRKHLGMLPLKGNMIDFRVIDCEDGRWMEMVQIVFIGLAFGAYYQLVGLSQLVDSSKNT
jgi:hypothetical protein